MWFTETAWPPMVILSVIGIVCLWMWSQGRAMFYLVVGILCGAGVVGSFLADQLIITDREQVELSVLTLADDVRRMDEANTLAHISARQDGLKSVIKSGFELIADIEYLNITDVSVEIIGGGGRARSHFRANGGIHVKGHGDVGHQPTRWELTWQKESEDWKVIEIQRLNPITGEEIGTLSRQE
ncbi:MAG: hypothetical protein KDA93_02910 [Planctomycetaceae bacterium]|nr:hypothetical protein [Planctomycetaceae bacterium]